MIRIMKNRRKLSEFIYEYPTKYEEGFTNEEIKELLSLFPEGSVDMKKFYESTMGDTCSMIDDDMISYHCDISLGIHTGLGHGSFEHNPVSLPIDELMIHLEKELRNLQINTILND